MAGYLQPQSIPSPLWTLSETVDHTSSPYPPNALPGVRDVDTFYGSMRVYEWGPEGGAKVVFVHGDATPAPVFAKIAQRLVDDGGHRVLLFDLWGRGYTDTPLDTRHDARLFAQQILFAIASSPLGLWAGSFALIGFSLGCPIALTFAAAFPQLVSSLVLLGPAGLIRAVPPEYENRYLTHPEQTNPLPDQVRDAVRIALGVKHSPTPIASRRHSTLPPALPDPSRVSHEFDMSTLIQWQFNVHAGHAQSFADTVRFGPLQRQHTLYARINAIFAGEQGMTTPLEGSKMLVFFGHDDGVVIPSETAKDLTDIFGAAALDFHTLPGGHGFPYPNSDEIARITLAFWKQQRTTHGKSAL